MEIQKSDKEQEKLNIEKVLEEKGYLMTAPFGTSMSPVHKTTERYYRREKVPGRSKMPGCYFVPESGRQISSSPYSGSRCRQLCTLW